MAKTSARIFSDLAQIQLICFIYSLISNFIALQRALIKMWVSGRNLPLTVSISRCVFTCELQSESSAIVYHISQSLCAAGFGVYETANL